MPVAEQIETQRLILEPLRVDHAGDMVAVLADPAMYEFTGGAPPSEGELQARYARQVRGAGWLNWILRLRESRAAVGTVQATLRERAELAWVVGTSFQGCGYATEGTAAVIAWLRANGVGEFEAHIHPDHEASAAVARRLGFEPTDAVHRGETVWISGRRCHN